MSMMLIYEAIKEKLGSEYPNVFYQTMREDVPGDVGIYLYESSNDRRDIEGDVVYDCIKVQVQVNSDKSVIGMQKALNYLSEFTRRIESEQSAISGITFIEAEHIGPRAVPIGKNQFNILVCRSVIDLKYIFEIDN